MTSPTLRRKVRLWGFAFIPLFCWGAYAVGILGPWSAVIAAILAGAVNGIALFLEQKGILKPVGSKEPIRIKRLAKGTAIGVGLVFGPLVAFDQFVAWRFNPIPGNPETSVVIYTAEWCGFCTQLRTCLTESKVPFTEKDIEKSAQAQAEHWALRASGVPATVIGKEVTYGLRKDRITQLLAKAGHDVHCWNDAHPAVPADGFPPHSAAESRS